jgi:ankyrin repeat protein
MNRSWIMCLRSAAAWSALLLAPLFMLGLLLRGDWLTSRALGLTYGSERLWQAVAYADVAEVDRAIAQGADIDATGGGGLTPLAIAAGSGDADIVRELLRRGANPDVVDEIGFTPLLRAIITRRVEVVELLLTAGANPNGRTGNDRNPLVSAVRVGDTTVVALLIDAGADVEICDITGATPLSEAVECKRPEVGQMLRRRGARR